MTIYEEIEKKLLPLCSEDGEDISYLKLIDISKVKKHPVWLDITQNNSEIFSFLITRIVYKLLILSCYWPISHTKLDYNDEIYLPHPDDIIKYISKEDEKLLVDIYNKTEYSGGELEVDAIDVFNQHLKMLALLSTQEISFPVNPIATWVNYLKNIIDSGDTYIIWGTAYGDFYPVEGLTKVLAALEQLKPKKHLLAKTKKDINFILDLFLSSPDFNINDEPGRALLNSCYTLFGLKKKTDYIVNNRNWTNEVVRFIEAKYNANIWGNLILHLSLLSDSRPTKKWLTELEIAVSGIKQQDLSTFYSNIIESICKESPKRNPLSSKHNSNIVRGLIIAVTYLKCENLYQPTMQFAEYSLKKIPWVGVHLPVFTNLCINSLTKIQDEQCINGLKTLRGDFTTSKTKIDKRTINAINSALFIMEDTVSDQEITKKLTNKETLKKLNSRGMSIVPLGSSNDFLSTYKLSDEGNVIELLLMNVKPISAWKDIASFTKLKKLELWGSSNNTKKIREKFISLKNSKN